MQKGNTYKRKDAVRIRKVKLYLFLRSFHKLAEEQTRKVFAPIRKHKSMHAILNCETKFKVKDSQGSQIHGDLSLRSSHSARKKNMSAIDYLAEAV